MSFQFANGWSLSQARAAVMLDPTAVYLNNGSFGPLPRAVFDAGVALREQLAREPMDFLLRLMPELLWHARVRLAQFLGGDPKNLLFTVNVSAAMNLVASSLVLSTPGEILLTDHEYLAMLWCWERAAQRQGLSLRVVKLPIMPSHPGEIVDAVAAAMTPRTRLLFFSHVLSPTGMVLPAKELCALARQRGVISVVDGAHAPAMLPLNLTDINADFYGGNGHKWLLAPTGSGFLALGPGQAERLQPLHVSWGWKPDRAKWNEPDEHGTTARLRFLEFEGTRDVCAWLVIPNAIDFQATLGFDRIAQRNAELGRHVHARFDGMPMLQPETPRHPALRGYLHAYRLPARACPLRWKTELWERRRLKALIAERPEKNLLRVSTHFYNTPEEIDRLADAVTELLHDEA